MMRSTMQGVDNPSQPLVSPCQLKPNWYKMRLESRGVCARIYRHEPVLEVSAHSRRRYRPNGLWSNLQSGLPAPNRCLRLYCRRRHVSHPIQLTKGMNSSVTIIRWDRWQCSRKPFDRRHQHPSPRPRGWRKASWMSIIHHAYSPR